MTWPPAPPSRSSWSPRPTCSRDRVKPFELLAREFRAILGHLSHRQIIWIAILSGAAEELVFRGTLQPWLTGLIGPTAALDRDEPRLRPPSLRARPRVPPVDHLRDRGRLHLRRPLPGLRLGDPADVAHTLLNAINLELIVESAAAAGSPRPIGLRPLPFAAALTSARARIPARRASARSRPSAPRPRAARTGSPRSSGARPCRPAR